MSILMNKAQRTFNSFIMAFKVLETKQLTDLITVQDFSIKSQRSYSLMTKQKTLCIVHALQDYINSI